MQSYKKIKFRKSSAGLTVIRTRLDAPWGISEGVSRESGRLWSATFPLPSASLGRWKKDE